MAEKEILKQLDYSSSEEEFIQSDDSKENSADLNLRRSKIGRFQGVAPSKKRKAKRIPQRTGKKTVQKMDEASKAPNSTIKTDTSKTSKDPLAAKTGYITSGRLTAGIRGIFGNSKSSNVVKRKGKRSGTDICRRKVPVEVKDQVNRNLARILRNASFDMQKPAPETSSCVYSSEEGKWQTDVLAENRISQKRQKGTFDARNSCGSVSTSSTSGNSNLNTPAQLSSEGNVFIEDIPYEAISRRLKDPLKISALFPGKSYLKEIREEIVKCFKQKVSILHDEKRLSTQLVTPAYRTQNISLTSVSKQRIHDLAISRTSDRPESCSGETTIDSSTKRPSLICRVAEDHSTREVLASGIPATGASHAATLCRAENTGHHLSQPYDTAIHPPENHAFVDNGFTVITTANLSDAPVFCPLSNPRTDTFIEAKPVETDYATHCQASTISQQQQPHFHDSGTYSSESNAREYKQGSNNNVIAARIDSSQSPCMPGLDNGFYPRRKASRGDNLKELSLFDCKQLLDHDYAHHSSTLDILHYAGAIDNGVSAARVAEEHGNTSRALAYVPTLKKPCLDTPSPPIQFYRRKMF